MLNRTQAMALFNATGVGTNGGVTVTVTGVPNQEHVVTYISGSSDAASLVTLKLNAVIVWRMRFPGAFQFSLVFPPGEYTSPSGTDVALAVVSSSSNCEANIAGHDIIG